VIRASAKSARIDYEALTGRSAFAPCLVHGFDAKLDCLVFGERAALLNAAQGLAAEGHSRHRLRAAGIVSDISGYPCCVVSRSFDHRQKISAVLVDVLDELVASEQVRAALEADTGKRIELAEVAREAGFDPAEFGL